MVTQKRCYVHCRNWCNRWGSAQTLAAGLILALILFHLPACCRRAILSWVQELGGVIGRDLDRETW